jgi:hypothetical protein
MREWRIAQLSYPTRIVDNRLVTAPKVCGLIPGIAQYQSAPLPGYRGFLPSAQLKSARLPRAQAIEFSGILKVTHRALPVLPALLSMYTQSSKK